MPAHPVLQQARRRAVDQAQRIGAELKLARVQLGLTRADVARRTGLSKSTVARLEAGAPSAAVDTLCLFAVAVGLDFVIRAYQGKKPGLRDTGQLELAQQLLAIAASPWRGYLEVRIGEHGKAADLVFFGPEEIIHTEIERLAADWQGQYRSAAEKRDVLAAKHARPVRLVVALEDTRRNRAAVAPHAALIRGALPAGSREILTALQTGRPLGQDGLLWIRRRASIPGRTAPA